MEYRRYAIFFLMMRTAVIFSAMAAAFGQSYTVTQLSVPSIAYSAVPYAINNSGQVAETLFFGSEGPYQAYIGSVSGNTPVPIPFGWTDSAGWGQKAFHWHA